MFANDSNNDWQVEIIKGAKMDAQSSKRIRALRTKFRLKHRTVGCYLYARGTLLPEWGGNQQEVSCLVGAKPNDFSTFYVHSSDDSRCKLFHECKRLQTSILTKLKKRQ